MSKSIKEICEIIEDFSVKRNFRNDDPNQLITQIMIELAELAENYKGQNSFKKLSEEDKTSVGFEFVDIIFFLFRFANKADIDIEKYFDIKLKKLEKKFPIGKTQDDYDKAHEEYRKSGKNKLYED